MIICRDDKNRRRKTVGSCRGGQGPAGCQEAVVEEFSDRLADFNESQLSDAQRAEVDRRLANPRYADPDAVAAFFARFGTPIG